MEELQQEKLQKHVDDEGHVWWMQKEVQKMTQQDVDEFMKQKDEDLQKVREQSKELTMDSLEVDALINRVQAATEKLREINEHRRQRRKQEAIDKQHQEKQQKLEREREREWELYVEKMKQDLLQQDQENRHQQKDVHHRGPR